MKFFYLFLLKISKRSLLLVFLFLLILSSLLFKIDNIECYVERNPDNQFCSSLDYLLSHSLFFTNFEETDLYKTTQVNDQGQVYLPKMISKRLPGTLIIEFIKKDPLYRLKIDENTYLVNSQNYLASDSGQLQLPELYLSNEYKQYIDKNRIDELLNQRLSNLIIQLQLEKISYAKLFINIDHSYLEYKGKRFLFSDYDNLEQVPKKIKLIAQEFSQIEASLLRNDEILEIDLRFELPVVRLEKQ